MAIDIDWVRENPEEAAKQIDLLSKERDMYRTAEEAQIAMRRQMAEREQALAAHVEAAKENINAHISFGMGSISKPVFIRRMVDWYDTAPTTSLGRHNLLVQADALDEAYKNTDDAAAQDYLHDTANALRRQAEGGAK